MIETSTATSMRIQFKGTNYELAEDMTDSATKKLRGLEKYIGKANAEPTAYVDMGKRSEAHQTGAIWYADCTIETEGKRFYAKAEADSLRSAVDRMVAELSRELRAAKQKQESLTKRSGSRLKDFFRFGR